MIRIKDWMLFVLCPQECCSNKLWSAYCIRPNYRTVRLGFPNLQDTLICGQICIYLLRIHYKKDQKRTYLMMTMRFFLTFFTKAYVVGTHLNCIDLSMQFKWVPTTYAFLYKGICCGYSFELHRLVDAIQMSTHNICLCKEERKKYTGCNLKTTEFLHCALIGVCAVIRSNTVCVFDTFTQLQKHVLFFLDCFWLIMCSVS